MVKSTKSWIINFLNFKFSLTVKITTTLMNDEFSELREMTLLSVAEHFKDSISSMSIGTPKRRRWNTYNFDEEYEEGNA